MSRAVVTSENVCDAIARVQNRQRGAATPDETEVAELTRWINIYLASPWDDETLKNHHDEWRKYENEQKVLKQAVAILQSDLAARDRCFPIVGLEADYERNGERLRVAIGVLQERCTTHLYNPPGFTPRVTGQTPMPWSIMARVLARETLRAVRAAQVRMGRTPQKGIGAREGVVVCTVQFWIKRITGKAPSLNTLYEALANVPLDSEASTGGI